MVFFVIDGESLTVMIYRSLSQVSLLAILDIHLTAFLKSNSRITSHLHLFHTE